MSIKNEYKKIIFINSKGNLALTKENDGYYVWHNEIIDIFKDYNIAFEYIKHLDKENTLEKIN